MKNKNMKIIKVLIVLMIFIALIIGALITVLNRQKVSTNTAKDNENSTNEIIDENEYFTIKMMLNQYYLAVNNLNANIEDLDIEDLSKINITDIETEQNKKIAIEYYTNIGKESLLKILDKNCIEALSLNADNLVQNFEQYKNSGYTIDKVSTSKKNEKFDIYYVEGLLDYKKDFKIIIRVDLENHTFSIYTEDYINKKSYNATKMDEFAINENMNIEQNEENGYTKMIVNDEILSQYYLSDYGKLVIYYPEIAYERLEEEYKKNSFATFDRYKSAIENSNKDYTDLQLVKYEVSKENNYKIYTCTDQYGDTYAFKAVNVMNYTIEIQ